MTHYQLLLTRTTRLFTSLVLMAFTTCAFVGVAKGATSTYVPNANSSGTWHNTDRWDNGIIPNAEDAVAILNEPVTSFFTGGGTYFLTLDANPTTVGSITINHDNQDFRTQINNGSLIFQTSSGPATWNENDGPSTELESRMRVNVPVTLNSDLIINQNNNLDRNTSTEFTQRIDAAADKTLTKEGFGNIQLSYTGALGVGEGFEGNLVINNGGVRLIVPNGQSNVIENTVFSKAAGITVNDGGQLQFGNHLQTATLAPGAELKLNGIGKVAPADAQNNGALRFDINQGFELVFTFNSPVNLQSASNIAVSALDATGVLAEEVRGVGELQKSDPGMIALSSANTYSGGTTIMQGALAVNNTTGSGVGTGDVVVSGGTLGGPGILGSPGDASNVSLVGGVLEPGPITATTSANSPSGLFTDPGTLTTFGDLTFDSASSLNIDLAGATAGSQYDQVVTNGIVSLGSSTLNVSLDNYIPTGIESFTLISGASAVNGEFGNYAQGAEVDLGGMTYYMNYMGGAGNDVVLSPTAPGIADADFDGDGDVDGRDFLIWQRNFGTAGGQSQGNANGDSTIDGADLAIWQGQYGNGPLGSVTAVPEPTTVVLLVLAVTAVCVTRPGRSDISA